LNERLSVLQISGVLLILAGVILSETARTSDSG
jgi:drug/metabolite transporter (DMT)-like permease